MITTKRQLHWDSHKIALSARDCPFSRLVYYLDSASVVIPLDEKMSLHTKLHKPNPDPPLTSKQMDEILRLARQYHPEIMFKRGLFRLDPHGQFCGDHPVISITLYFTKATSDPLTRSIVETKNDMVVTHFTPEWLRKNYYDSYQQAEQALLAKRIEELTPEEKEVATALDREGFEHLLALLPGPNE
jgi:hypothetical protein